MISTHTLCTEGDAIIPKPRITIIIFQSTPSVRRTASKHVRCLIPPTVSVQTRNLRIVGDSTEMNLHRRGAEIKPTPVHAAIDPFKGMIPNPFSRRLSGQTTL